MSQELDIFGKMLVQNVRDYTINTWYGVLSGQMKDSSAIAVRELLKDFNEQQIEVIRQIIPRIIDETMFEFLFFCENSEPVSLSINIDNNSCDLAKISDGLAGELLTDEGWIAKYSEFPVYEDNAGIN